MMMGKNIAQPGDVLVKTDVFRLGEFIAHPTDEVRAMHYQLQSLWSIDAVKYGEMMRWMPYVVSGIFNPPVLTAENFGMSQWIIFNLTDLNQKGLRVEEVKKQMARDNRVAMVFSYANKNAVCVILGINKPCYDANKYYLFWHKIVRDFLLQHNIIQVFSGEDGNICKPYFVCWDPLVYMNRNFSAIDVSEIEIELETTPYQMLTHGVKKMLVKPQEKEGKSIIMPEQMEAIKKKLGIATRSRQENKKLQQLADVFMNELKQRFEDNGLKVEIIQRGYHMQKIAFWDNNNTNKVLRMNIFFDKKGIHYTRPVDYMATDSCWEKAVVIIKQLIIKML